MSSERQFNILVVDDDRSNLDVLVHILKSDYQVQVAKSGEVALKIANQYQPDLILLDVLMPDLDGFEVLTRLKESDVTRHIPVIFITGLVNVEDEEKGFLLGAVDYIVKPFNNAIVQARVRTHIKIIKQMRMIERLGLIDALTDVPNRRAFDHQVDVEWSRAVRQKNPLSMMIIDVDKFKVYNDTYGHPQGDVLLQAVAKTLQKSLKRPADFMARIGGEEFSVILPATDLNGALQMAEDLRANVEACRISGPDAASSSVTVSIGVSSIIPSADDLQPDFIARVDAALYEAKRTGRNRVCFS
ncbi:diguanylate cyclase response regulator [Deltaproteobacteria bacterium Smac51]|nr:diguanylate cyclase response regulator [Deltaproteobacteria bacterium Smac51]